MFNDGPLELYLHHNPQLLGPLRQLLNQGSQREIFDEKTRLLVPGGITQLEQVWNRVLNAQQFIFDVYDSYADRTEGDSKGFCLYRMIQNELEPIIGLTHSGAPQLSEILKYCRKHEVTQLFTTNIENSYHGVKAQTYDDDKDCITHEQLDERQIGQFKSKGIEIIVC